MKVNYKLYCLFLLSCSALANKVQPLENERYHISIPSLSADDTEDGYQRNLESSCTFGARQYTCLFDSVLEANSGDDVPINLHFECDWDYYIGVDIQRSDCTCEAIIYPGTLDEHVCRCAGCPIAEMMAYQHDGRAVDRSEYGVAVDCGLATPQPSFVVDDCSTLDCFGECNGIDGLPWLSTEGTEEIEEVAATEGTEDLGATENMEATEEADAVQQTSQFQEALNSINEATTNLAFGDLLTAVGASAEKEQQIIQLAEEMEKGDFTAEELQETVIASNSIADQTSSTADVFFYSVIEGDMTVETIVRLNEAISVIVSVTDVTGADIIAAVDNEILSADEVISVADGLTNNDINPNELEDFLNAVYAVNDVTVGLAFTDIVNAVGSVTSAKDEKLVQLVADIKKGTINGEDLQNTVIATNNIRFETGRPADVFFYSVIDGEITVDTIMDLSQAVAVIMEATEVSGEDLYFAIQSELLTVDEVIIVAFDYVGAVVELGDLKDFIDAVAYLQDVVHEAHAEDGSADLEDFLEDLLDDVDDGVLDGDDLIDLAEDIEYVNHFTDVDGYEIILLINDGLLRIDPFMDFVDEMKDHDDIHEHRFDEFIEAVVDIEEETVVNDADLARGMKLNIIDGEDVIELGERLEDGSIAGGAVDQLVADVETISDITTDSERSIWDDLVDQFGANIIIAYLEAVTLVEVNTDFSSQDIIAFVFIESTVGLQEMVDLMEDVNDGGVDANVFALVIDSVIGVDDVEGLQSHINTLEDGGSDLSSTDITTGLEDGTFTLEDIEDLANEI